MARYIDADNYIEYIEKNICGKCIDDVCGACMLDSGKTIAEAMPTADVEEVKHGEWVYDEESAKWGFPFICTAKGCGKAHNHKEKYCPNCGAKMDGGKAE